MPKVRKMYLVTVVFDASGDPDIDAMNTNVCDELVELVGIMHGWERPGERKDGHAVFVLPGVFPHMLGMFHDTCLVYDNVACVKTSIIYQKEFT